MGFRIRDYTVRKTSEPATGIIAQEVQISYPELVTEGEDGLMVGQPGTWMIVKVIQELFGKIEDLEARISALEAGP